MNWISIKDQMPDAEKAILVTNGKSLAIGVYDNSFDKFWCKPQMDNITHWHEIELPEKK